VDIREAWYRGKRENGVRTRPLRKDNPVIFFQFSQSLCLIFMLDIIVLCFN